MPQFDVSSHREDGALVVVLEGELDIATVDLVRASLAGRDEGFALRLLRARPGVQRVFGIAGIESVLPFADEAADA